MDSLLQSLTNTISLVSGGAFLATAVSVVLAWFTSRTKFRSIELELGSLEIAPPRQESTLEHVTRILRAAVDRRRLSMLVSERRATILFRIGTGLTVLSVLVPFLLVLLYFQQTPAAEVQRLVQLGVPPKDAATLAGRDWHLLFAGVSFGLLFLAAAKGLLTAEARQRDIHDRQDRVIEAYEDALRGLNIAARLDSERADGARPAATDAMKQIARSLLEPSERRALDSHRSNSDRSLESESESTLLRQIADLVKR